MAGDFSRRKLLKLAGGGVVGAGIGPLAGRQPQTAAGGPSPAASAGITETLARYMSSAAARRLPDDVAEKTKQAILDTFAAMISGSELPPGRFAIQFARGYKGAQVSTIGASNALCGPIEAAMANGMLAHADETDDSHPFSQSHPGCSVVPAALAVGEQFANDGNRLMRAVALGYDIGPRITIALGRVEYMAHTHRSTHALSGTFGAAAAAGCAAGLNEKQMRWLLSYTAQQASGIASWQRDTDHIEKAFDFGGMPARNGVTSALLVQAGGTGVDDVFSGADNFFQAFLPENAPGLVVEQLGERYEVMRTSFKKWSVGSPIQAVLDALEIILKRDGVVPGDIKQVLVRVATNEAAVVNNRQIPDISLQHMAAVMLVDGTLTFKSAHDTGRMKDPAVLRERAKIQLIPDAELERQLPQRQAIVEIILNNGSRVMERVNTVRGTMENPMTRDEVVTKARDLIAPVLGPAQTTKLIDAVFRLETMKTILELRPLLTRI